VSAGANLHPAGQTESDLVSRVPPRRKIGASFGCSTRGGFAPVKAAGRYMDVLSRRKSLKGTGTMDPGVTMSREEIAAFALAKFKLRRRLGLCDLPPIWWTLD
jgi:hypothetical protein